MTKVWLFDLIHYPHGTDPVDYDPALAAKVYEDNLNLYEAADGQGFDGLFLGEHHFTSYTITPSPNLMIAALSQRTKNMRIGLMVNVVPFNHPLRMAEEAAMLDLLTRGRLELGLGRGVDEQEFEKWHMPFQEARPRFEEGIDLMKAAWTQESFAHEGTYYNVGPLSMWPRPLQQPHPPIWIAALSPETIEWSAREGYQMSSAFLPVHQTKQAFDRYRAAATAAGQSTDPSQMSLLRHVFVAETDEEARAIAKDPLIYLFALFVPHAVPRDLAALPKDYEYYKEFFRPFAGQNLSYEDLCDAGIMIAGSPETVRDEILRQRDELGFGNLFAWMNFGNLSPEHAMSSQTLFAEQVLPDLHAAGVATPA